MQNLLHELFRVTPPTALIVEEAPFFRCEPPVSHIRWDSGPVIRRIVRWAANVSRGREDLRQTLTPAEFVPGGTIGPVGKA